jgi:hypothetical protein
MAQKDGADSLRYAVALFRDYYLVVNYLAVLGKDWCAKISSSVDILRLQRTDQITFKACSIPVGHYIAKSTRCG